MRLVALLLIFTDFCSSNPVIIRAGLAEQSVVVGADSDPSGPGRMLSQLDQMLDQMLMNLAESVWETLPKPKWTWGVFRDATLAATFDRKKRLFLNAEFLRELDQKFKDEEATDPTTNEAKTREIMALSPETRNAGIVGFLQNKWQSDRGKELEEENNRKIRMFTNAAIQVIDGNG